MRPQPVRPSLLLVLIIPVLAAGIAPCQEPTPSDTPSAVSDPAPEPQPAPPAPPAPPAQPKQTLLQGIFKDAFLFRTPDGANELRIGAAAHLDGRAFFGDSVAPDSFDIRRARLDVRTKLHGFMSMRIQAALENRPYIRNAWLDLRFSEGAHLLVGQMKVPFSTEWMTLDNQVNFLERGTSTPVYPFFDRGMVLWGDLWQQRLTYHVGVFTGAGVDNDYTNGDVDDHKDVVLRLFSRPLSSLYLVVQGTYGASSVPTSRFETRGLAAADYESQVWRWRTEQVIGSNDRTIDQISGEIDSRSRWGAELLSQNGALSWSVEWLVVHYDDIAVYHDLWVGSNRLQHQPVLVRDGDIESLSAWISFFLTGEHKSVDSFGWRQPDPASPWVPGEGGSGAWELLARLSATTTDAALFDTVRVAGFSAAELGSTAPPVGEGSAVSAAVLQGAAKLYEASIGVNWTVNHNLRLQLGLSTLWAPDFGEAEGGGGIISGGASDLADRTLKNRQVEREHELGLRFIFRI